MHFRVYRDLTICCWSLNIEGSSFLLSHPTPSRRPNHPNLFLLGFSSKLILWLSSFFQNRSQGSQAERAVRQGQGGQGRAGQERGRRRVGGRAGGPEAQKRQRRSRGGQKRRSPLPLPRLKSARKRLPGAPWGAPFLGGPKWPAG